ncbi:MAG TPA: TIGR00730 family Rossman fold protein [Acidisarcina sp.]|nr:TIGR00730 family Rossman fold protein [Acidisarcina sp.]
MSINIPDPPHLAKAPLAYENPNFLNGPDGRIIRILSEYSEPLARFRRERIQDTVVFFGSARFRGMDEANHTLEVLENTGSAQAAPSEEQPARLPELEQGTATELSLRRAEAAVEMARYYEDARRLAYMLTKWSMSLNYRRRRFVVTSGGGPGIMEAANRGAYEAGGKTIGLNIRLPFEQEPNPYITPSLNFEFHYFFMRKYWFAYMSKALVVFPGGFGTLDEMFELLTLSQTNKLAKKMTVVIYGSSYWNQVLNLDVLVDKGAISPKDRELFQMVDTPEDAFAILKEGLTRNHLEPEALRARQSAEEEVLSGWTEEEFLGPEITKTSM